MSSGYLVGCIHDDHVYVSFTDNIKKLIKCVKKMVLEMNNLIEFDQEKWNWWKYLSHKNESIDPFIYESYVC
jgi:hypothetical protein